MSSNWGNILDANTSHLSPADVTRLTDIAQCEDAPFRVHELYTGFIVSTAIVHASGVEAEDRLKDLALSDDLVKLMKHAASRDANLIVFDEGAPVLDGFKVYEEVDLEVVSPEEATKKMLDVSTGNVTPEDWNILSELAADEAEPITVVDYEYGYVVGVTSPEFFSRVVEERLREKGLSAAFINLMRHASENGAKLLQFDRDADPMPGFPLFESDTEDQYEADAPKLGSM